MSRLRKTDRTTVRREKKRGSYDRALAYRILDEGLVAHVGLDDDVGPVVIPMAYARCGDELLLHGSVASRALSVGGAGLPVCVTVTLLDGIVVSRSWFNHSMNYRSVVVLGAARLVEDPDAKLEAMAAIVDHLLPGSRDYARAPSRKESAATSVLSLSIEEASVKVRSGPPIDARADLERDAWTGVVPLRLQAGEPVSDSAVEVPAFARDYRRGRGAD